ncbi:MAG: hypothetical protein V7603_5736 [Micromonosporaceae bacterium]
MRMDQGVGADAAITDPLTGAYSRALLTPRLGEELSRASRSGTGGAVFLFDVDYFKSVNDAYGHGRGDAVLCELVSRIGNLIRGYDVLFRYGGDEFVVLLPDTDKADAVRVALRLVEGVRGTPFPGEPPLRVSVSLGVALFPEDATDGEALLACADRRNYLAKQRGRACAVVDDADVDAKPESSRLLERDVPLAVVHEFLTRLVAERRGALRVAGEAGAGHSRFLGAVERAARLRGLAVKHLGDAGVPELPEEHTGEPTGTLLVADRGCGGSIAEALDAIGPAAPVGLVYATTGPAEEPQLADLPLRDTVELLPWSSGALRIWLRTRLRGEPDPSLIEWLVARTGGLPARVEREVDRLSNGGLAQLDSGGWTLAPALLARRSRPRPRLPVPLTELVGRQRECAQVAHLLAERRLVTLVGAGGIGKTRLSLAVASAVADRFPDGVVFVPLAEAAEVPGLLLAALAAALDIAEVPGQPLAATLAEELAEVSLLLVLDNFEHVLDAAAVVSDLLSAAPGLRVLASSRERLSLSFEQVYPVPPLPLPDPRDLVAGAEGPARALAESPALALFTARARAAAYDFALTEDNLLTVAELCRRLDGLPLAIELAAARADSLSPAQMLAALAGRLEVAGDGPRDLPARQRTLRGAIDWSMSLLDPVDRDLFERLGAFAGGCELGAVVAAGPAGLAGEDIAKRLSGLVDKSLLRLERPEGRPARYTMLRTIHAYAVELLAAGPDAAAAYRAHGVHYATFAIRAGHGMAGPRQARWAARVEREYQNLRAAFERSLAQSGSDPDVAVRVALGLWRFWRTGSHIGEGRQWLARLAPAVAQQASAVRAQVLHAAAVLAGAQDDHESASALAAESLALARESGDARTTAQACNALGIGALAAGDYPAARGYFTDSLAIWHHLNAPLGLAIAHGNLTKVALRTGDIDTAGAHAVQCLELDRRSGNTRGIMLGLLCLGEIMLIRQDTGQARVHLTEALVHSRSLGDVFGEAMALHHLGRAAWHDGDHGTALRQVGAALALRHEVGDREDLAISLELLAALLADGQAGDGPVAARLLGAAQTLRNRHRLPEHDGGDADTGATLAALRERLGPPAVAAALTAGQHAALDAVVADAMACVHG